ncbi:hypothetical protein L6452_36368 [Arctium lappa]|uniref:Uncharacterized protein n=1 Tax=Arctium lappa TaxID=4217 RepID=A0ACB8YA98_ARCLA|nr:hypothetical protein L6452_36368 [Arctium lappa]
MSSMERSESPRNTAGSAIGIRQNGWRALDQLGVTEILRHTAISIHQRDQPNLVDLNPSCPPVPVMSQLIMSLVVEVHQVDLEERSKRRYLNNFFQLKCWTL